MSKKTIVILSVSLFVGLLFWGVYTFISYLGVPAHGLVYMSSAQVDAVSAACPSGSFWCRGWEILPIFIGGLFKTSRPFFAYVIISLLAYGTVVVWRGYSRGQFIFAYTVRPLHLALGFMLAVWLFGTTLATGSLYRDPNGMAFSRFYEPTPQVYSGVGEEALQELQANYQSLLEKGCLAETGLQTQNGARIYDMKLWCMQKSLIVRAGTQMVLIAIFILNLLIAGRLFLRLLRMQISSVPLLEFAMSFGLGALAWVAVLWTIAVMGFLTSPVMLIFFFGWPIAAFTESRYWLLSLWSREWSIKEHYSHLQGLLVWLLVSYLAINFLNVIRPFPIGWDDLGSYLNRPKLLASYGSFIPSMASFQWEYMSAMAFAMFGVDSIPGATFAMIINWSAGLLAVLTVFVFARLFLGPRTGVLAAILYYFLPMVGHFSFADMKIDNATFFVASLSVLVSAAFLFGTPGHHGESRVTGNHKMLLLAGLLGGFAFGVKWTSVLGVFIALNILAGGLLGWWGFASMAAFSFLILAKQGPFNINDIAAKVGITLSLSRGQISNISVGILLAVSIIFFVLAVMRKNFASVRSVMIAFAIFGAGVVSAAAPWMVNNLLSHGWFSSATLLSYNDYFTPQVSLLQEKEARASFDPRTKVLFLPADLAVDPEHPACKISSKVEELDRYWGYGSGWKHYLTLPWRAVMNVDAVGYYVTLMPGLLLFPLLLLLPFFWSKEAKWLRLLFAATIVYLVQWVFVGNGIPWYGIGMFLGFAVGLATLCYKAPDKPSRILASTLIAGTILVCLVNRMWQFDVQKNLFEFPLGKATTETIREVTIPHYDDIRDSAVERHESMPDRPYTFRMGTFIPYFIPKSTEILPLADHQLAVFNCINQERDHQLTLKRLQALGFNGMIFDTNTATIEKDQNGTLHQKVNAYLDFVNDQSLGLDIVINDPAGGVVYLLLP